MNDLLSVAARLLTNAPRCEQCNKTFEPRRGSGGKAQKYFGTECKSAARAQRAPMDNADGHEPTPHERRNLFVNGTAHFLEAVEGVAPEVSARRQKS